MGTELAYLDHPFQLEFEAEITDRTILPDGRKGIILRKTFFYPTGGGQEYDTGVIGDARVSDVLIDDEGTVVHVVDRDVPADRAQAKIDGARRRAFMQHHTAQHLLSAVLDQTFGMATVSSKISIDSPTTIDVEPGKELNVARAEELVNQAVFEDRAIKSYFINEEQIATIPFRRPPKVRGQIRVVEIEAVDYSACGGTHCSRMGMVGLIKILKTERRAEKLRVYFVAGGRALGYFQSYQNIVSQVAQQFDTKPESIADVVARHQDALRVAQKELDDLRPLRLLMEARQLVAAADSFDACRLIITSFRDRTPQELRALAAQLQTEPGVVALLASFDGTKVTLMVTCASDTDISANELIRKQLAEINGRGGGDAKLAQGGGAIDEAHFAAFFANTEEHIRALRK